MARGDHQNGDDDFMDPPQQNRATGRRKEGDKKKKRTRNRASQERLTSLTDRFTDDQNGAAAEMGMQALMNVRCTNLVNPLMYVDCLDLSIVDFTGTGGPPPTHKFAISAWTIDAVKAVLDADRVTDTKYGKLQLMAKHAIDYNVFGGLKTLESGWTCTQLRLALPRSSPCTTTSNTRDPVMLPDLRKPVKKVKKTTTRGAKHIIRDPLERLHSKLSTGGNSDVHEAPIDKTAAAPSTVLTNSDASGRPSPPVADVQVITTDIRTLGSDESVSVRTGEILPTLLAMKDAVVSHATPSASVEVDAPETNLSKKVSLSSDTDSKRVRDGTPVSTTEVVEAAVHNDMPSTGESLGTTTPAPVGADIAKATVSRAGLPPRRHSPRKQSTDIPNAPAVARSSRDESGYVPTSTLFLPPAKSNVMEKPEYRSTTDVGVKPGTSDAGERPEQTAPLPAVKIPSLNLRTSRLPVNVGVPYSPNKKIVKEAAADTADNTLRPTNKPDHSVATDSDMFVDFSPLDSAPQVVHGPAGRHERHPMAFTPPSFSLGISQDQPVVLDPMPVAFAFPGGMPAMMAQPMVEGRKAVKFAEPIVQGTPKEIPPSLDEPYRRIKEAALQRRSSQRQGQSSSNVPADTVSEDTIRSDTPGSVRQQRVVHPPPAEDYEPEVRATKEQTQLYDIVKRFGNARASSKHMKELKATKVIQCEATSRLDISRLSTWRLRIKGTRRTVAFTH
ncbi:hypothetical protein VPH35_047268 [Triticum aestivum]